MKSYPLDCQRYAQWLSELPDQNYFSFQSISDSSVQFGPELKYWLDLRWYRMNVLQYLEEEIPFFIAFFKQNKRLKQPGGTSYTLKVKDRKGVQKYSSISFKAASKNSWKLTTPFASASTRSKSMSTTSMSPPTDLINSWQSVAWSSSLVR